MKLLTFLLVSFATASPLIKITITEGEAGFGDGGTSRLIDTGGTSMHFILQFCCIYFIMRLGL
jgi:hypothetical protein